MSKALKPARRLSSILHSSSRDAYLVHHRLRTSQTVRFNSFSCREEAPFARTECGRVGIGDPPMKCALLFLTLGCLGGAEEQFTILGTIDRLARSDISVKTQRGSFRIVGDSTTEVVKDKSYHDFSPLKVGDEVSVRCQPGGSGKLVATRIWAKVVSFAGTVKDVRGEEIEVITNSGDERRIVRIYPDTVFGTNRDDVTAGKQVRITGLDVGSGAVDATRVALYNTDVPARR